MNESSTRLAAGWERLVAGSGDEEAARLGRLFNTLMVISTGIVIALSLVFLSMQPLGLLSARVSWIAAAFPLAFIPLSLFCLVQSRRGRVRPMVRLYVWVNLIAIGMAAWLFDGVSSPAWLLFIWTITVAGSLLAPAYALWMMAGVASYYLLLLAMKLAGLYTPLLTFGDAGREFIHMAVVLIMLISTVGLLTWLNMSSLREALEKLRKEIGERKRAEETVERLRRELEIILEAAGEGICTMDLKGNHVLVNPAAARMLGYEAGEMTGRHSHSLWHYAKADGTPYPADECPIYATMRDGVSRRRENEVFWKKDGSSFPVEYVSTPIWSGDAIAGTVVVFHDIAARKQMEQALSESECRFRSIFDTAPDGIFTISLEGVLTSVNQAVVQLVGWSSADLVGTHFSVWIHPDDLNQTSAAFFDVLSGKSVEVEARVRAKGGGYKVLDFTATPLIERGGMAGVLGFFRDVSERKRMEEEIRRWNEALEGKVAERTRQLSEAQDELLRKEKLAVLGQVAGSVGHELRNPLGVMSNAVYFLQTVLAGADDSVKEYLNILKNEIAGSERIVSDLLDSVRTRPPQVRTVRVAELVAQSLGKLAVPPAVQVKLEIPPTLLLRVDALQMQQVLRNLVSNAIEAMPGGGVLQIGAAVDSTRTTATVRVRDSGMGMPPEQMGKLFQPLFTTKARGIGLGLVVVKNLTEANGGKVAVESAPQRGTTFTLTLPAASGNERGDA